MPKKRHNKVPWTDEELQVLRRHGASSTARALKKKLGDRHTLVAIYTKLYELEIHKTKKQRSASCKEAMFHSALHMLPTKCTICGREPT